MDAKLYSLTWSLLQILRACRQEKRSSNLGHCIESRTKKEQRTHLGWMTSFYKVERDLLPNPFLKAIHNIFSPTNAEFALLWGSKANLRISKKSFDLLGDRFPSHGHQPKLIKHCKTPGSGLWKVHGHQPKLIKHFKTPGSGLWNVQHGIDDCKLHQAAQMCHFLWDVIYRWL